jgi:hypothetical protein
MPKVVSFEVSDENHARLLEQQRLANLPYVSTLLRALVEDGLAVLESNPVKTPVLTKEEGKCNSE